MKIAIAVLHFGLLRNFESVVESLAGRGHDLVLLADEPEEFGGQELAESLAARYPNVRWEMAPAGAEERWYLVARKLRVGLDYLRFLDPRYSEFPKLRDRAAERAPRGLFGLMSALGGPSTLARGVASRLLAAIDEGMPRSQAMDAWLRRERPDVLLLASVTHPRAPHADHLRSARALGIRVGVCVYSWDHLSSKSLVRVVPDRVLVWNETQKREATELHGLPADRIDVTGAQVYDQWFDRRPHRDRAAFMDAMGLPADRPLILYVCSAMTPDPHESAFIRKWLEAVRQSDDAAVRTAAVLVRPHPERRAEWEHETLDGLGPVVVAGRNPVNASAKADYFDALFHSSAVIGLVTSAFLEAAIVGRPVLTVLPDEMRPHQSGMLHFRYLLEVEGGLLMTSRTLAEHVAQLADIVSGRLAVASRQERFLRAFVRPAGLDTAATPIFVERVEAMASRAAAPAPAAASAWKRALARRVVAASDRAPLKGWLLDAREHEEVRRRDGLVGAHRREHRAKWRAHRRRKLADRIQWKIKRVRDLFS